MDSNRPPRSIVDQVNPIRAIFLYNNREIFKGRLYDISREGLCILVLNQIEPVFIGMRGDLLLQRFSEEERLYVKLKWFDGRFMGFYAQDLSTSSLRDHLG